MFLLYFLTLYVTLVSLVCVYGWRFYSLIYVEWYRGEQIKGRQNPMTKAVMRTLGGGGAHVRRPSSSNSHGEVAGGGGAHELTMSNFVLPSLTSLPLSTLSKYILVLDGELRKAKKKRAAMFGAAGMAGEKDGSDRFVPLLQQTSRGSPSPPSRMLLNPDSTPKQRAGGGKLTQKTMGLRIFTVPPSGSNASSTLNESNQSSSSNFQIHLQAHPRTPSSPPPQQQQHSHTLHRSHRSFDASTSSYPSTFLLTSSPPQPPVASFIPTSTEDASVTSPTGSPVSPVSESSEQHITLGSPSKHPAGSRRPSVQQHLSSPPLNGSSGTRGRPSSHRSQMNRPPNIAIAVAGDMPGLMLPGRYP